MQLVMAQLRHALDQTNTFGTSLQTFNGAATLSASSAATSGSGADFQLGKLGRSFCYHEDGCHQFCG
jgi:hypothetical protein